MSGRQRPSQRRRRGAAPAIVGTAWRSWPWARLGPILSVALLVIALLIALGVRVQAEAQTAAAERSAAATPAVPSATPSVAPTMLVFGDAAFVPADGTVAWPRLSAAALGLQAGGRESVDFSYTTPAGQPFREAMADLPARASVIVFAIGERDRGVSASQIAMSASSLMASAKAAAPGSRLVVVAPFAPSGAPSTELLEVRNGLRAAASIEGALFVDPIGGRWLVGCEECVRNGYFTSEGQIRVAELLSDRLRSASIGAG